KIEYAPYYDGYSGYRANVQITRFNLGPKIREELIADYGEEHAAPAEELGVGPHVSWRVVFQPIQGKLSMTSAIVRKELTDAEAEKIQCIEIPCMSLSQPRRGEEKWTATETPEKDYLKAEDSVPKADLIDR